MANESGLYGYLLGRLPLILTFASGYIVYLLLATTRLTDGFVWWTLKQSRGNRKTLLLYVMGAAALLSFFIPNAVTVLTLLPFIKTIDENMGAHDGNYPMTTALTLSVIYGANIGGMGSIIGSPANLLLIGALDLYQVPGKDQISFLNWFVWSIPLVLIFIAFAWGLVATFALPKKMGNMVSPSEGTGRAYALSMQQKRAGGLFIFFLLFWIGQGLLRECCPSFIPYEPHVCTAFFILFSYLSFIQPVGRQQEPLLRVRHIIQGLPKRGLIFLGVVALIIPVIRIFDIDQQAADLFSSLIRQGTAPILIFLGITLGVIFLTEGLSNTVVSTAFFPIVFFASGTFHMSPLVMMIAVSVASTCAFMTPIATPCNALAFGEMKRTSLAKMLLIGFPLNIIGACLITLWLQFVIPLVYA